MKKVKKFNVSVKAFELGEDSPLEKELIASGKVIKHDDFYEIFSTETDEKGELAHAGDFVKIDNADNPYPNARERFLSHHKHIEGNNYVQFPQVIMSWTYGDQADEIIEYLLESGQLEINPDSVKNFYKAELWGTVLTAKKQDVILIYSYEKDGNEIKSVDFNLIDKDEFDKTYEYI